jgi:hypothetical protein
MKLSDLLEHEDVQLPASCPVEQGHSRFVARRMKDFMQMVRRLEPGDEADRIRARVDSMTKLCDGIERTLGLSMAGKTIDAYSTFNEAIAEVQPELQVLQINIAGGGIPEFLFRVRVSRLPLLSREELHHVSFENRHLVATQRYSIPGLPCLYLAGSLFTCWEEMGRPPLHEMHCAAFWAAQFSSIKLLNFLNRPVVVRRWLDEKTSEADVAFIAAHVVTWPLMFACSVKVKHRESPFKPEYIVPQMVFQWVRAEEELRGVAYFSTHVACVSKESPVFSGNVALPARDIKEVGKCSWLDQTFHMTDAYGWQLLSASGGGSVAGMAMPQCDVELVSGVKERYHNTLFGSTETRLRGLALKAHESLSKRSPFML